VHLKKILMLLFKPKNETSRNPQARSCANF